MQLPKIIVSRGKSACVRRCLCILCTSLILFALAGCSAASGTEEITTETKEEVTETMSEATTAATTTAKREPELLFEDNFDGDTLDKKKWEKCPEWDRQGGSKWDDDYAYLDGQGHLILHAEYQDDGLVHAGAVRTNGKWYGGYGYYEASIKFEKAYGTWGAFWMMVGNLNAGDPAKGIEIDVVESIHNEKGQCNHALHWDYVKGLNIGSGSFEADIYDGEFHRFGCLRSERGYVFYIDGKATWSVPASQCAVNPLRGYMKLTVEAAEWAGAKTADSKAALPSDMVVDWVRVWSERPKE